MRPRVRRVSRPRSLSRQRGRAGFTLVELLVVIAIVLLASIVAIPAIYSSLGGRQVTDAARIFTGALVGARDSAIKYNSPRGIRLLADPVLTLPALGSIDAGKLQLCYNRIIPIEPAGDYYDGKVTIGPQLTTAAGTAQAANFPPLYPRPIPADVGTASYPFASTIPLISGLNVSKVLMIEASPYVGGYIVGAVGSTPQPNSPTSWYWNIRLGDKIQVGSSGRSYTIVGPCVVNPWNSLKPGIPGYEIGNTELFVNAGPPGAGSPLTRTYYYNDSTVAPAKLDTPEFLFVVNGEDDDLDGYADEGWDGFNNDGDAVAGVSVTDELDEWETEGWKGSLGSLKLQDYGAGTDTPSNPWVFDTSNTILHDLPYIIKRRPVPTQGAREVMLPTGMVVDATTWNSTQERSRLPVQAGSLYCDIMVNPSGLYVPTTEYSSPTSASPTPFLHFWLTSREDVHPRGSVWGMTGTTPNPNPSNTPEEAFFELPLPTTAMSKDTNDIDVVPATDGGFYPGTKTGVPILKGERRLVTMFAQSGLVTTNAIESIPQLNNYQPGEGFNVADVGYPFYKAQLGQREAR